jgi:hypothetical protein
MKLFIFAVLAAVLFAQVRDDVPVLPYPEEYRDTVGGVTLQLYGPAFKVTLHAHNGSELVLKQYPVLDAAVARYRNIIFENDSYFRNGSEPPIFKVQITLSKQAEEPLVPPPLQTGVDMHEEYTMLIDKDYSCKIFVASQWGVLRALESLSQLISYDEARNDFIIRNVPIFIEDRPRFHVRFLHQN